MKTLRLLLLSLCLTCVAPVAQAQATNPTAHACGLPSSGTIVASETYTLIADCAQTGTLEIRTAETPNVELIINGAGFTISNGTDTHYGMSFLVVDDQGVDTLYNRDTTASPNVKVDIRNVTFDNDGWLFSRHLRLGEADGETWKYLGGSGSWILAEGVLEMENVTFTQGNGVWLRVKGTATLTNVLFEDSVISNWGISPTIKGVLHVTNTGKVTLNKAVFRDIARTVVVVEKGGSLSSTDCLSFIRTFTHNVHHSGLHGGLGTWSDSSTGPCSGSIGNGGTIDVDNPPTLMACGLPASGIIGKDAVYTLEQDCVCMDHVYLATGVSVTINGNGFAIYGCGEGASGASDDTDGFPQRSGRFLVGGFAHLKINNANIYGIQMYNYGGALTVGNSMIAETSPTPIYNHGFANIYDTTFHNNRGHSGFPARRGSVYYATNLFRLGRAIFRDNMFSRNSIGPAELVASGGGTAIFLCGENQREAPAPEDGADLPPLAPLWVGLEGGAILTCPEPESHNSAATCYKQQPLGAIGLICHVDQQPAAIEILEISPRSEGSRILRVNQSQIESIGHGLVACSADGRAAVRVGLTEPVHQMIEHTGAWRDARRQTNRVIQVSMGPTFEDKVHHVVIDHVLNGHVLGTVDTRPDSAPCPVSTPSGAAAASAPAPVYAPPVVAQEPRADGSIIHVVGTGDTIWAIGVAYDVHPYLIIERNALGERGRYIYPGQELLIREASG